MTVTTRDGNGSAIAGSERRVHEAVAAVLSDLPAIAKDGTAPGNMGGYKFRRVEDITAALKPLFAKNGLLCLPSVLQRVESVRQTAKGGSLFIVDLEIAFRFIGPAGDELVATVWGEGSDSGDKALQKAVTSAFKTMLSVVFCISDSESDAEAHDVPESVQRPRRQPASKDRIDRCKQLIIDRDLTDWIKAQGYEWPWTDEECKWIELYAQNQPGPNATVPVSSVPPDASVLAPESVLASLGAELQPEPAIEGDDVQDPSGQVGNPSSGVATKVEIAYEVDMMPLDAVHRALESAGLSTKGAPRVTRERLAESRYLSEPF